MMDKILSAGTLIEFSTEAADALTEASAASYVDLSCVLTGLSTEASENEQIDVTTLCDTHSKAYLDGLKDADSASGDAFVNMSSEQGKALQAAADGKEKRILRVTFEDGTVWASLATLQPFGFSTAVGDAVKTTLNFRLIGKPEITTA